VSATLAFIADENVDAAIVRRLRADSRDVLWVAEMSPGTDDDRVLAIAIEQARVLITSDNDLASWSSVSAARLPGSFFFAWKVSAPNARRRRSRSPSASTAPSSPATSPWSRRV
jgi:hypothetical protein